MYQTSINIFPLWRIQRSTPLFFLLSIIFLLSSMVNAHAASVNLAWDKNPNTSVVGYKIYYKANSAGAPYTGTGLEQGVSPITFKTSSLSDPNNPQVSLSGFEAGRTYYFVATAYDGNNNESGYSNEVKYECITDTLKPSIPAGLIVKVLSSSNVFLNWNAATDSGGSGVAGYDVYRNEQLVRSTSDLGFNDSGLNADTEYRYAIRAKDKSGNISDLSAAISIKTLLKSNTAIRVNAGGGSYIDASGNQWQADAGFNTGRVSNYTDPIQRTQDDVLHQSARWDSRDATELSYVFNVPNGNYRVNLYFTEAYSATSKVGGRLFSVLLENVKVITNLDIFAEAGHDTALIKSFDTAVTDGNLNITFQHGAIEDPEIAAIEVLSKDNLISHTINSSAGSNGGISPQGALTVVQGASPTYTITANPNYKISNVIVDGTSVGAVPSYTFGPVTRNHTISAQFTIKTYSLTAQAGDHGEISPVGASTVNHGGSQSYTITPATGYRISDVLVDGKSIGQSPTHTFSAVSASHTISATFAINSYALTAEAGANGSISPSGKITVAHGGSRTYTISANNHYEISDVKVDGQSIGATPSYTFANITKDHMIAASFVAKKYQIEAKNSTNGTITPAGISSVSSGASMTYTFTPNDTYILSDVKVDGASIGAKISYTFPAIFSNHVIEALFEKENQAPIADAGPDQTVEEGSEVTLAGHNSIDLDNGIASFFWEQINDGPQVVLSDNTNEEVRFIAPDVDVQGVALKFRLVVTDMAGIESEDTCIVNTVWVNMPPKAETALDLTVAPGAEVLLDGSNSSDPDGGIKSYQWVQKSGTPVNLNNANTATAGFIAPNVASEEMSLTFELTIEDEGGLLATATSIVNVSRANAQPVADAGPNQTVAGETEVALDGSNSTDSDGDITGYAWTQTHGIPVLLSDPSAIKPVFITPNVGFEGAELIFKLTVTDAGGLKSQDTCVVIVDASIQADTQAPTVSIMKPVSNATYETSETVLSISGAANDAQGVVSVTWSNSNGGNGIANGTTDWSITEINLAEGANIITITAVDNAGNSGQAILTVTRKAQADTMAPDLKITSPSSMGFYFTSRSQVDVKGTCSDDTQVKSISWNNSTGGSGQTTGTSNWTINGMNLKKWFNIVTITATDAAGNTSTLDMLIFRWPF